MEKPTIWLIHHKASLDEMSSMNLDGSEYMVGTAVVPASSLEEAMVLFEKFLEEDRMDLLELSGCEQYDPANFNESEEKDRRIIRLASRSMEDQKVRSVGISSEAMSCY